MSTPTSPIVIIGMHRTGTSMLTRMLEQLGLFCGWRKQGDHEALLFLELNDWILEQAYGCWDNPERVHALLEDAQIRALVLDYLRFHLATPRRLSFLGPKLTLRYPSVGALDIPWGWKDPRTTFTLPLWLELFPNAKLIHVYRHGVDVAASLRTRHQRILSQRAERYHKLRPVYSWVRHPRRFTTSLRCASLEGGLSLWESYTREAHRRLAEHSGESLSVCYETFLKSPATELERMSKFCDLAPSGDALKEAAESARASRAFAFLGSEDLRAFARAHESTLSLYGYSADGWRE